MKSVISAAHCVSSKNERSISFKNLKIFLGLQDVSKDAEIGRQVANVSTIHIHDKWNTTTPDYDGDIAVIKLSDSITFNSYIRPVCLSSSQELSSERYGVIAGWGYYDDTEKTSHLPRQVELPIVEDRECFRKENQLANIIWNEAFCAGKDGVGVCRGDSGSGFYVEKNGIFYLRGILSSSSLKLCSQNNLAIYSDVLKYIKFIRRVSD